MSRKALRASLALWQRRLDYRTRRLKKYKAKRDSVRIQKWGELRDTALAKVARRRRQLEDAVPRREKALRVAKSLIGVMEEGGNNNGPVVMKIIRANGGSGPEPWCGDFVAYCYRAFSRAVTRPWASVQMLRRVAGVKRVARPLPGDIVIFTFDHTGLFVRDLGDAIETIEGNTGASGAVSDSRTGGDGVYRKRRPKSLVAEYLRVTR